MKVLRQIVLLVIEIGALAALSYGSYLAWRPAGFIVPGSILFTLCVVADLRANRVDKEVSH